MPGGGRFVSVEPAQRAVDFARGDRQPDFPRLDLHAAHVVGGAQSRDRGELLVVCGQALPPGQAFAVLLLGQHAGDQQDADAGPQGELGADGKIVSGHRPGPLAIPP